MNLPFRCFGKRSKEYKLLVTTLATLILGQYAPHSLAANDDFSIEEAQAVDVKQRETAGELRLSFSGFGQTFNLVLEKNKTLLENYSSKLLDIELYAGEIEGNSTSWARITELDGNYTGAIYDGRELYLIDSGDMIAGAIEERSQGVIENTNTVIFRASDVSSELACGADDTDHGDAKFSYQELVTELQDQVATVLPEADFPSAQATATRQVNLDIVADTQYVATSTNGAEAQVLSQMNIVDGIFSEQVGVQFGIQDIRVLSNNGSLTSTNASTLLNQYRTFVGNNNPGLSHLFTGREIDGNVIGIAFVSAICTTSGVGVTQAGGRGTLGALTAAHEFGHNFGSPHDNQAGSACVSTPGTFLMNPSLNGSDEFSQCSLDQIDDTLAVRSSCLVDVEPPEPNPTPGTDCSGTTNFAGGANGFTFIDDAQTPAYTDSSTVNGALNVSVGGVDNDDISNMEGVWRGECESETAGAATISVNGLMTQASDYEANEFSEIAVRINGQETTLATLTGDGNGGPTMNTGAQTFTVNTTLAAGTNTIELVCFNNLKTFANESTSCSFTSIEIDQQAGSADLLNVNFNSAFGGFSFADDTSDPAYSDGSRTTNSGVNGSGALQTVLGGVDNADIQDMDASWTRSFNSPTGQFTLSLDANLVQSSEYEANETSEIGIRVDGQELVLNSVAGNGNGGGSVGTGFQRYNVSLNLGSGTHSLSLFCRNSEKTFNNETTTCTFDNVLIQ